MSSEKWYRLGLIAAIGVFLMPIVTATDKFATIRDHFADRPGESWTALTLAIGSMALQGWLVFAIWRYRAGGALTGRRVAIAHALFALAIFLVAACWESFANTNLFYTWYSGWFGPDPTLLNDNPFGKPSAAGWFGLYLLPELVAAQWAFLMLAERPQDYRAVWRGIAVACIATSALMGIHTFSPLIGTARHWKLFEDATSTFFNVGVAVHLVALWQILVRSRFDWAWAALIGFGCLSSGLVLTRTGSHDVMELSIGETLRIGWYGLSPYLPIFAYAITAIGAVALYRTRPERARPAPQPEPTGDSLTPAEWRAPLVAGAI